MATYMGGKPKGNDVRSSATGTVLPGFPSATGG